MKLLIADPSKRMRELIKLMCCELGDEVCECASASALLEDCATRRPDCVILDESLAGDNFAGLVRRIKSILPAARVVVLSLDPTPWFQEMAAEAGASACVPKEDLRQLRQVIRDIG
ncbi:MAG: response regulator transcription factor [Verrucomicrobia bacterium]|nr:response regulator transcription factor [Verrucomicrobiota bacterium]